MNILSSQKSIPFWGEPDYVIILSSQKPKIYPIRVDLTKRLYFPVKILSPSEGTWLCDYNFQPEFYPTLRGLDYVIILSSRKSITFWGNLTMYLYFSAKNLSHSEVTWLFDCVLWNEIYNILRGPDYVIILSSQNFIPFWGDLTMWLYLPAKSLLHSEGTWLCDYSFQLKIYPILRGPGSVIIFSSQKHIPFRRRDPTMWLYSVLRGPDYLIILSRQKSFPFCGDLTMWFYFPAMNLSHSEGSWLCDYTFLLKFYPVLRGPDFMNILSSQKSIPFWGEPDYVIILSSQKPKIYPIRVDLTKRLYFPVKILSPSEGTWLCDYNFQPEFYPTLRGLDYVIILSSRKSITFWGNLTMYLYFSAKNLSHSEVTWLFDCVLYFPWTKSITFWGDLTMWLYFHAKILSHSEGTWLCDYTFQPKVYYILRKPDYVLIIFRQKSIPFWGDLTLLLCPKEWNLSHSEGAWQCDYFFPPKTYPILRRGPDYVNVSYGKKTIPFWKDLTIW